MYKNNT